MTHNPNLAVVCDADQVVYAKMNKVSGNAIAYETGALENPSLSQYVTDVLEGTRSAFGWGSPDLFVVVEVADQKD